MQRDVKFSDRLTHRYFGCDFTLLLTKGFKAGLDSAVIRLKQTGARVGKIPRDPHAILDRSDVFIILYTGAQCSKLPALR